MSEVLKVRREKPDPQRIAYAAHLIRSGQVVAVPTDTFYGLAADPFNLHAVEQIYRIKGRPSHKPLLLLVGSIEQAEDLTVNLPETFFALVRRFWPGPLTLLAPAAHKVPRKVTGNTGKVALRWPNASVPNALVQQLNLPLTGTSANLAGLQACSRANEVQEQLGDRLALILDGGESGVNEPSTIVEVNQAGWKIVREGAISTAVITEFFSE